MEMKYDIYAGVDVGKYDHHICAIDKQSEKKILNRKLTNTEGSIGSALDALCKKGKVLIIVDQPGSLSSLLFTIAKHKKIDCAFITPKAMKKVSELYDLPAKTDKLDAFLIADASMRIPFLMTPVIDRSQMISRLEAKMQCYRAFVCDSTRCMSRIHELLHSTCPAMERIYPRKRLHANLPLFLLVNYGGASGLRQEGRIQVKKRVAKQKGFGVKALNEVDELFDDLEEALITSSEAECLESFIKESVEMFLGYRKHVIALREDIEDLVFQIPEAFALIQEMKGVGPITAATIVTEIKSIELFENEASFASHCGFAPTKKQSGKTHDSTKKAKKGNRKLKGAISQSTHIAARDHDESRRYFEKKLQEGKLVAQAKAALSRHRIRTIYKILKRYANKKENA